MIKKNIAARVALVLFFMLTLNGCALIDRWFMPEPELNAEELFEAGNDAIRAKDYVRSVEYFTKLKESFPFSPYAVEAELSLADSYYLDEEWLMAAEAYKEFETMHPRHESIPYILYQIGMSNLKTYTSIDRPPTAVEEAYSYFTRVRDTYAGDEYATKATEQMVNCRKLMAEYEINLADFYFRTENYGAARLRYQKVIDDYTDVPELFKYASEKVNAAYLLDRQKRSEETRREREGSWRDWFNWL